MSYNESLAAEIEEAELELSGIEPQLAELKVLQGKTADIKQLFDLKLEIDELEERGQELRDTLKVLASGGAS